MFLSLLGKQLNSQIFTEYPSLMAGHRARAMGYLNASHWENPSIQETGDTVQKEVSKDPQPQDSQAENACGAESNVHVGFQNEQ